ncbi:9296_t:CDS:2, partial [Gigaspora rosea]
MATQGHGQSSAQGFSTGGGYAITTTKSGQQISISITGGKSVEGVLIYTLDSKGSRIGTFTVPSGYQTKSCTGSSGSTLTHTNQNLKNMPINFMWAPPSGSSGNVTVRAIVVQNFANWLKLQDVSFDPSSGTSSVSNVTIPQSGSTGSDGSDGGIGMYNDMMNKRIEMFGLLEPILCQ